MTLNLLSPDLNVQVPPRHQLMPLGHLKQDMTHTNNHLTQETCASSLPCLREWPNPMLSWSSQKPGSCSDSSLTPTLISYQVSQMPLSNVSQSVPFSPSTCSFFSTGPSSLTRTPWTSSLPPPIHLLRCSHNHFLTCKCSFRSHLTVQVALG